MVEQPEKKDSTPVLDKFHEIELEKTFDGIADAQKMRLQLASFFGTANLAVLSVGLSTQKAILFFLAGVLIWAFLVIDIRARRSLAVYFYRVLQLQTQFAPNDNDVYVGLLPIRLATWVREFAEKPQREQRIDTLYDAPLKAPSVSAFWLPFLASITEICIGLVLVLYFSWQIF